MRLADFVDGAPTMRRVFAVLVAALAWLGVLVAVGHWLGPSTPAPPHEQPLEMRVVELENPPPAPALPPPPKEPVRRALPAASQSAIKPPKPVAPRAGALPEHIASKPPDARPAQSTESSPASPTNDSANHVTPAPATEKQNAPATTASTGDSAAHPIAQPLPELPDDLREQAYQTVATARFTIHTDGSIDVDLIKPTPSPRLNQILLEVLHKWRFFPAMQSGHPIESRQDIRVHFNVD